MRCGPSNVSGRSPGFPHSSAGPLPMLWYCPTWFSSRGTSCPTVCFSPALAQTTAYSWAPSATTHPLSTFPDLPSLEPWRAASRGCGGLWSGGRLRPLARQHILGLPGEKAQAMSKCIKTVSACNDSHFPHRVIFGFHCQMSDSGGAFGPL